MLGVQLVKIENLREGPWGKGKGQTGLLPLYMRHVIDSETENEGTC